MRSRHKTLLTLALIASAFTAGCAEAPPYPGDSTTNNLGPGSSPYANGYTDAINGLQESPSGDDDYDMGYKAGLYDKNKAARPQVYTTGQRSPSGE
jgi:hypothetical protein